MSKKTRLRLECLLLFYVLPPMLYLVRHQIAFRIFFVLVGASILCMAFLLKDPGFDRVNLWRRESFIQKFGSVACIFLPTALLLTLITKICLPDKLFAFPATRPVVWSLVMILYPLLLVWPQELIFRSYFFHRYHSIFANPRQMIQMNAISFSLAHLFYNNWVALLLSFLGGYLFAWRYHRSRSLPLVSLEHALWGDFLFTVGLGWYFYSGAIV